MEDKSTTVVVAAATVPTAQDDRKPPLDGEKKKKKKKRSPFNLLKAALFMLGRKSKSVHVEVASKGMLNKLVGSMRPLHLQDNQSPPPPPPPPPPLIPGSPSPTIEPYEDVFPPPMSPHSSSASSSADSMSRYASATNLQELEIKAGGRYASAMNLKELDKELEGESDDESDDHWIDDKAGDEMIDAKAEEFIAHFYTQMRIQHVESIHRHNKMMAKGKQH
uniref:Uncharacterized protein n=1 Tax=Davidia involucrata TaxID=16924 RepID=A0A5B7B9H1_DAVIN